MNIKILECNKEKVLKSGKYGDRQVLAYWCKYESKITQGYAFVFPSGYDTDRFCIDWISVETTQKKVSHFRILDDSETKVPQMIQIGDEADYFLVGVVDTVIFDDSNEIDLVCVWVDDILFAFGKDEFGNCSIIKKGDWVQCIIKGLCFYDAGY